MGAALFLGLSLSGDVSAESLLGAPHAPPEASSKRGTATTLPVKAHNSRSLGSTGSFFQRSYDLAIPLLPSSLLIVFPLVLKLSDLYFPSCICHMLVERASIFPWYLACCKFHRFPGRKLLPLVPVLLR